MDPVHGGGPCFVLSRRAMGNETFYGDGLSENSIVLLHFSGQRLKDKQITNRPVQVVD